MKDILTTLREDGNFETLLHCLNQAGLLDKLAGAETLTLFAPDDQACTKINVEEILADREKLSGILTYHLVTGNLSWEDVDKTENIDTLNGKHLTVHMESGVNRIDNAGATRRDIQCSNGIIHVIDNVFLPQFSGWYCACC